MNLIKSLAIAVVGISSSLSLAGDFWGLEQMRPGRGHGHGHGREFVLRFDDRAYRGQNTLYLKREIQRQYGVDMGQLRQLKLRNVLLIAKTRMGQGTATLQVGHSYSHSYTVMGRKRDFESRDHRTFDHVTIDRPGYSSDGPWQVELNGNFKVRKVIVRTVRRSGRPGGGHPGGDHYGRSFRIACQSFSHIPTNCSVNGYIRHAYIVHRHSHSRCIQGRTWGFYGNTLWVSSGCRAVFEVSLR